MRRVPRVRLLVCVSLVSALAAIADESPRSIVRNEAVPAKPAVNALPPYTAISAKGFIHSTERGFRFPDGTVQSTAATVTGGVPSVNGIAGEVTISGTGATSVSTSVGLIQIHTPVPPPVYTRTVIVSPYPGNDLTSGTRLINAVNAASSGSLKNATLIKVEPGRYDIGTTQLVMKPYVDIEGSGEGLTRIVTRRGGAAGDTTAAGIIGASNSELRDLYVETLAGSGLYTSAVATSAVTNFRLRDVTLHATGADTVRTLQTSDSQVSLDRVTIVAWNAYTLGAAVFTLLSSDVTISNSFLNADGDNIGNDATAVHLGSGKVTIRSSTLLTNNAIGRTIGFYVNGTGTVTHSTVHVEDGSERRGVALSTNGTASVYHSLVMVGNEWVDPDVRAGFRPPFAGALRFYASYLDSHSTSSLEPLCINSFWLDGALNTDCTKAP